jgi:hypothetical protein
VVLVLARRTSEATFLGNLEREGSGPKRLAVDGSWGWSALRSLSLGWSRSHETVVQDHGYRSGGGDLARELASSLPKMSQLLGVHRRWTVQPWWRSDCKMAWVWERYSILPKG